MAEQTIRIGFIGAGANTTARHIPGFQAIDGVELISVSNRSAESSQRVADQFGIPSVYENWMDLIEADDTDAICIGTWPYMHCIVTLAALESGKHVLTEARMAMNAAEARIMLEASLVDPDLVTQIVPAPHTLAVDDTIKEMIADGYLGEVLSVDLVAQGGFIDYDAPMHWRNDRDLSGFNMMAMGIWYEAMMRWVGPAAGVMAVTRVNVKSRKDEAGEAHFITVPDHAEIVCEMESGPVVHMRFSQVTGLPPADAVWLFGTEGTLKLDSSSMTLYGGRRGDDALSKIDIPAEKQGRWRVEEEFISAIRGNEKVTHTNFQDGVRYMEFTEAVARSAQSRKMVRLPL
ncbi:MAG: Gfo/Idh/MocA family oxidoreductase [Chloroflexi bacterium]|nr:Gfo/Idh/MocA family oxidoreductase [Chloroflexota bacterium]